MNKKQLFFLALCLFLAGLAGYYNGLFSPLGQALAQDSEKQEGTAPAKGLVEDPAKEMPCPECPECPDPAKVVLRGLEEKKNLIENSRKAMDQEKKELERYEQQIDEKLLALEALKKQINDDMALLEEKKTQKELEKEAAYEEKMGKLVKMYAAMKPKDAAFIVDKMSLEVAQEIFVRMREASGALILSSVDAEKAAKISERLVFKRTK